MNKNDILNSLLTKRQEVQARRDKHTEQAQKDKMELEQIDAQILVLCPDGLTDIDSGVISIGLKPHIKTSWQKMCGIFKDKVSKKLYNETFEKYTTRTAEREILGISYKETL